MDEYVYAGEALETWGYKNSNKVDFKRDMWNNYTFYNRSAYENLIHPFTNIAFFIVQKGMYNFSILYSHEINCGEYKSSPFGNFNNLTLVNRDFLEKGKTEIGIARVINFDSNMVANCSNPDSEMLNFIENIKDAMNENKSISVSPEPYIIEVLINNYDFHPHKVKLIKCLMNFYNVFGFNKSKKDVEKIVDDYEKMQEDIQNSFRDYLNQLYALTYYACYIRLFYKNKGIQYKIMKLLNFISENKLKIDNNIFYLLSLLAINDKKTTLIFSHLVQLSANEEKIIKGIDGMALDLFHLRFIQYKIAQDFNNKENCVKLHEFATRDEGLNNLINGNKLTRFAIIKNQINYGNSFIPHFENSVLDLLNGKNRENALKLFNNNRDF
ncbi:hypothetical protein [Fructilactobacillus frigidiflavus]|uniref:hypothetical protein n=1 Tax=Fructilactobacillus frigidiflavus TaxID=3242688 RepID=UPI0037564287